MLVVGRQMTSRAEAAVNQIDAHESACEETQEKLP